MSEKPELALQQAETESDRITILLLPDLRDLARSGGLPAHLREHVRREIARRSGVAR